MMQEWAGNSYAAYFNTSRSMIMKIIWFGDGRISATFQ